MLPDDRTVAGLITLPESRKPHTIGLVIGKGSSTGLLENVSNVSEWAVRGAAAKALKAVGIAAGMSLEAFQVEDILRVLNIVKHDKVKPVRTIAADALALFLDLQVEILCKKVSLTKRNNQLCIPLIECKKLRRSQGLLNVVNPAEESPSRYHSSPP